jgi:hypothetical protein
VTRFGYGGINCQRVVPGDPRSDAQVYTEALELTGYAEEQLDLRYAEPEDGRQAHGVATVGKVAGQSFEHGSGLLHAAAHGMRFGGKGHVFEIGVGVTRKRRQPGQELGRRPAPVFACRDAPSQHVAA